MQINYGVCSIKSAIEQWQGYVCANHSRDATFPDLSGIPDFWPAEQPFRIFSIFVCYHGYSSAAKPEVWNYKACLVFQ